jgi:hypothetical protein
MFGGLPEPTYMPCVECGATVARVETDAHVCERERWVDYQMFQSRDEVDAVADELAAYLSSPTGRFELWCAERDRGRLDEAA